jgi:hypothetical protein
MLRRYFGKISPLNINQLRGHNGELVIDEETNRLYIMDGIAYGGQEILGGAGTGGPTGPAGAVVYDGGRPNTDFSVGINMNCGGVS